MPRWEPLLVPFEALSACLGLGAGSERGIWWAPGLNTQAWCAGVGGQPHVVQGPGKAGEPRLGPSTCPPVPWTPPWVSSPRKEEQGPSPPQACREVPPSTVWQGCAGLRTCTVWRERECLKSRTCPCCTRRGLWQGTVVGSGSEENKQRSRWPHAAMWPGPPPARPPQVPPGAWGRLGSGGPHSQDPARKQLSPREGRGSRRAEGPGCLP